MGARRGPYEADFPVGTVVRTKPLAELERFRAEWTYHHNLLESQLACAAKTARLWRVSYYHGGDELYELDGAPGYWHECCLQFVSEAEPMVTWPPSEAGRGLLRCPPKAHIGERRRNPDHLNDAGPDRALLVQELVEWRRPVADLLPVLRAYTWDCERPLFMLTRVHMARALDRCLASACTSHELAEWAEAIDCREDIELEPGHADVLQQVIVDITIADAVGGEHGLTHAKIRAFAAQLGDPPNTGRERTADPPIR